MRWWSTRTKLIRMRASTRHGIIHSCILYSIHCQLKTINNKQKATKRQHFLSMNLLNPIFALDIHIKRGRCWLWMRSLLDNLIYSLTQTQSSSTQEEFHLPFFYGKCHFSILFHLPYFCHVFLFLEKNKENMLKNQ